MKRSVGRIRRSGLRISACAVAALAANAQGANAMKALFPKVVVEVEEVLHSYEDFQNGAGPMWAFGNTCIVRSGTDVWASAMENVPGTSGKSWHAARWALYQRTDAGWTLVRRDEVNRSREPFPLALLGDEKLLLSDNPAIEPNAYSGPATPMLRLFVPDHPYRAPVHIRPEWRHGHGTFIEHGRRTLATDPKNGELILFHITREGIATGIEWTFRDRAGNWIKKGTLSWPMGNEYDPPVPIPVLYPCVLLRDRAVFKFGAHDMHETNPVWREYYRTHAGSDGYSLRRLFYTWTPDITDEPFRPWLEIDSSDETGGWTLPCDLWRDAQGRIHLLWWKQTYHFNRKMREHFWPGEKQVISLCYGVVENGELVRKTVLYEGSEDLGRPSPSRGRFHVAPGGRLFALWGVCEKDEGMDALLVNVQGPATGMCIAEIYADGTVSPARQISLKVPLQVFYTATPRAGCEPSWIIDLLGENCILGQGLKGGDVRYARVRLIP